MKYPGVFAFTGVLDGNWRPLGCGTSTGMPKMKYPVAFALEGVLPVDASETLLPGTASTATPRTKYPSALASAVVFAVDGAAPVSIGG